MTDTALTLRAFNDLFPDEDAARAWFERARWPDGPVCPVCGCVNRACRLRTIRRWERTACRRQFSVTAGTPMHRTHLSVNHSQREYARTDEATGHRVHVNRVESFNGFLGRAVVGVFHFVSPKHLGRHAGEAAFRWNRKADACLERMALLVRNGVGRTLPYGFLTGAA